MTTSNDRPKDSDSISWLDYLADAAAKATPGQRRWNEMDQLVTTGDAVDPYKDAAEADYSKTPNISFRGARLIETDSGFYPPRDNDRPFFAACDPQRILKLVAAVKAARAVMDKLEQYGPSIVPHLLDTDENDGQRLRDALDALSASEAP